MELELKILISVARCGGGGANGKSPGLIAVGK
jgi:hypothetical protein